MIQDCLLSFFAVQVCHGNLVADLKAETEGNMDPSWDAVTLWRFLDPGRARDLGSLCLQHLLKDLQDPLKKCGFNWSVLSKYPIIQCNDVQLFYPLVN